MCEIRWSKENLEKIVSTGETVADCLRKLGISDRGSNFRTFKNKIREFHIDCSHFKNPRDVSSKTQFKRAVEDKDVFCEDSKASGHLLRQRYLKKYPNGFCSECGVGEVYNHRKLTLHIDHINGRRNDNREENLRYLCPNCHSQTKTFGFNKRV